MHHLDWKVLNSEYLPPIWQVKQKLVAAEIVDSVQQSAFFFALHALGELAG